MKKYADIMDPIQDQEVISDLIQTQPIVTIITVSTNESHVLDHCLKSIMRDDIALECIVIDNFSTDQTNYLITEKYKDFRLIPVRNSIRKGLAENCNIGLRKARGRYILILNPDTVLSSDTLKTMVLFMDQHPDAAISTCRLVYSDGTPQDHVRRFPTPWAYFCRILKIDKIFSNCSAVNRYLMRDLDRTKTQEVDWFITSFFFIRKTALDQIGLLSENFIRPYYCEDIDFCYRSKLNGYRNYYVAEASTIHHYQQSSQKKLSRLTFVHLGNIFLFYIKHGWTMLMGKVKSI